MVYLRDAMLLMFWLVREWAASTTSTILNISTLNIQMWLLGVQCVSGRWLNECVLQREDISITTVLTVQQHHCEWEIGAKFRQNENANFRDKYFYLRSDRWRQIKRSGRGDWALTWNMTLYCSSGFWTTHMLHPIVTSDPALGCANAPRLDHFLLQDSLS